MAASSVPPEVWEKIAFQARRSELASLALVSRRTYPVSNPLLYRVLEFSFCKCSQTYLSLLERTFQSNAELANLVIELNVDMRALCRVKDTSSDDNIKPTKKLNIRRVLAERLDAILGREEYRGTNTVAIHTNKEWNRTAVQALEDPQIDRIFSRLFNIAKVSVVLGHYSEGRSKFMSHTLSRFSGIRLVELKLHEASLFDHLSGWYLGEYFARLTGLRCIDLGYMPLRNVDLNNLLYICANSLEELRLHWIMQADSVPFFTNYEGPELHRLKVLVSKGPQAFHYQHVVRALGAAAALEEINASSLSFASASSWAVILGHFARSKRENTLKILNFGAMTSTTIFWQAVAELLRTCGGQLKSLYINGSPKGRSEPLSNELWSAIATGSLRNLSELVLMWRDKCALSMQRAGTITDSMPALKLLHICLRFPCFSDTLIPIAQLSELQRLHLSFYEDKYPDIFHSQENSPNLLPLGYTSRMQLYSDLANKGPRFRAFLEHVVASCPRLREVSWSIYGVEGQDPGAPSAYVEINRYHHQDPHTQQLTFTDLNKLYRDEEGDSHFRYRITVGRGNVLINKKPGWREEMGHTFETDRLVCPYASGSLAKVEVTKTRRAEL